MTSLRDACLPSLLAIAVAACAGPEPFREGVRISHQRYPQASTTVADTIVTRLVDDLTGQPVIGAEVFLVDERQTPIAGEFWFTSRFVSDAEGFIRIERPPGARGLGWQVVRHPSYGVGTRSSTEAIWRLGRAFDVPVLITDWLGRPAPGARIGFCGGCGHTPDLVNAIADGNGHAVLRGIDPRNGIADLYVQHPGLHNYYQQVDWRPGEPPELVRCDFAPPLSGRVVDHRGQPVAGAFVCGGTQHRGPWARTDDGGAFVVLGAEPPTYPYRVLTPAGRMVHFDTSAAWPVTLRLPDLTDPAADEGTVEDEPEAAPKVDARAVRVVVEGAPEAIELDSFAPDMEVDGEPEPGHVFVPARGPFVVFAIPAERSSGTMRRWSFADGAAVTEPLVVQWTPDVRLVGRAVATTGEPVAVGVRIRQGWSAGDLDGERDGAPWQQCRDGVFDLVWERHGTVLLEIAPTDATLRPRLLWVDVPAREARRQVDLGNIVITNRSQLSIVDERGDAAPTTIVGFARAGWQEAGEVFTWPLAADGSWRGPDLRAGDAIVVQRDAGSLPYRTALQGDGPWTIAVPAGQLDLTIVDADGRPLDATVVVADHEVKATAGAARLRGLPVGQCRAWVSAESHRSAIVDALVGTTGQTVRVVLQGR